MTFKCGREETIPIENNPSENNPKTTLFENNPSENTSRERNNKPFDKKPFDKKPFDKTFNKPYNNYNRNTFCVKLLDLPEDISELELRELLLDWGYISKIRIYNNAESTVAYIDFQEEAQAIYFVEAIHKTPFDNMIISAELKSTEKSY
jgi:hypothetical protein